MSRRRGRRAARAGALALALLGALTVASPVGAQPQEPATPTVSAGDRRDAARHFTEGERAFKANDYARAAGEFEAAHRLAPHPSALYNAARAWQRAGERVRAANLYAKYLRDEPADAPDHERAAAAIAELSPALGRVEVSDAEPNTLHVDGEPLDGKDRYVSPGAHTVTGRARGRDVSKTVSAFAGKTVTIALGEQEPVAPPLAAAAPRPPASSPPPAASRASPAPAVSPAADEPHRHGWSPLVVVIGAGVTAVSGSWTIWSGVDALNARKTFDAEPTAQHLDEGRRKQARTNLLIGLTAGVGVFTAVAAIWLVDWKGPRRTKIGLGPSSVDISGSF